MAKLNIFVVTYGENSTTLLTSCLNSLEVQSYKDFSVFSASSGEHKPSLRTYNFPHKHTHFEDRKHFPEKVHLMYKDVDPDCEYVALLNDDVILNKDTLAKMIHTLQTIDNPVVLQPLSNCDNGKMYVIPMTIKDGEKYYQFNSPQYRLNDIDLPLKHAIMNGDFIGLPQGIFLTQWVCFYCTVMHRSTYETTGGIDPAFKTGKDDLDFCLRAAAKGFPSAIDLSTFCFHYSGITADKTLGKEEAEFNDKHFKEKYG